MIIGSTAIKHWFPDFNREPKDLDIIKGSNFNDYFPLDLRREYLDNPILLESCEDNDFLSPDELYTLKVSHSFWDLENNSWDKHMWDIQFLKSKGCKLIPDLFDKLYQYWNTVHSTNKRSKLDMSAEEFFDNAIKYPVGHDELHQRLVQHKWFDTNQPMYYKVLKDGCDVDVEESKWNDLTEHEKFRLVFEEVAVMAVERFNTLYYKAAYNKMLKKFIISHAPLWEAVYIIENHKMFATTIPFNYLEYLHGKTI